MANCTDVRVVDKVYGEILPEYIGEIVLCTEPHPYDKYKTNHVAYIAFAFDRKGWIKIGEHAGTKPVTNHKWNSPDTWVGTNRWIHYENDELPFNSWGNPDTWIGSNKWVSPDPTKR